METLTMNDGTVIENSHVIQNGKTLWFYLSGVTFDQAYRLMSKPAKTQSITADFYGSQTIYTGFTNLFCLTQEESGIISGGLKNA